MPPSIPASPGDAAYGYLKNLILSLTFPSPDPNLAIFNVWIDCLDPALPRICLFAKRDIARGEQLTFDYCQDTTQNSGTNLKRPETIKGSSDKWNPSSAWEDASDVLKDSLEESPGVLKDSFEESPEEDSNGTADRGAESKDGGGAEEVETPKRGTPCLCGAANCKKVLFGT